MSNQITHVANKITYRWTFNQTLTGRTGTFWDGSPYVINAAGLKVTNVEMITEHGTESPNTIISNIELGFLGKTGFTGNLYINGLMKNPNGMLDYDATGNPRQKNYAFDSRSFNTFNKGWIKFRTVRDPVTRRNVSIPLPTNEDSTYPYFNLTKFLEIKSQLETGGGIDVTTGDVLVVQWSNFNRDSSLNWNVSSSSGYPYQRITSRSCVLSYGTLFVLNAHPNSGQVSFRPPVIWPEEDRANRPCYPVSQITARLPASEELVENPVPRFKLPNYSNDTSFRNFCYGFAFGGGIMYTHALPLYSGSTNGTISAYGAYYQAPLLNRLITLYSAETNSLPGNQRLENLKVLVQWGIDAFGSIKSYASTQSGAGQKPCAARPWSILAGYFLNVQAMREPETTMLADTGRLNGYLNSITGDLDDEDGTTQNTDSVTSKMIELYGNPNAAGAEGLLAKKRWLALQTSLEAVCYYRVVDNVGAITDYRTLGPTHRRVFSGAGANLQQTTSDIQFAFNQCRPKELQTFSGTFARIQWNTVPPDLNRGWAASHDGKSSTFWYSYIKVVSGPGSGDTLYRIIKSWGDFRNARAENQTNATGFGFILDRPWQNGQPDQTSRFEMITCTEKEVGDIFYLIGPTRFSGMADANLSPSTMYGPIAAVPVTKLYGWMNYIETLTGTNADLDKGSVLTHEYVQQILTKSPYEWVNYSSSYDYLGSHSWEVVILDKWYNNRPSDRAAQAAKIDWSMIPGISYWHGITVSDYRNLPGDFNLDGVVNKVDVKILVDRWNAGLTGATFDLNKDGNVNLDDLKILINDYYGKTQ